MNTEMLNPSDDFLTNDVPTDWEKEIRYHREREYPEMEARFQKCQRSGQPFIEFIPASGSILYAYFDRSQPPTDELIDQLDDLAESFELCHYHVLEGDHFQECLDSSEAVEYQGRYQSFSQDWSPEQTQSFIDQLSQLLPKFDRQAKIKSLVEEAISAGYFTYWGKFYFGDENLEFEAEATHEEWCKAHDRPCITLQIDDAYFTYQIFDKELNEHAVSAINSLTRSVGLEGDYKAGYTTTLDIIGEGVPLIFAQREQIPSFISRLIEILSDPRSSNPRQA